MKFSLLALAFLSLNSFAADKTILNCQTGGDGLSHVELVQKDKSAVIRITKMNNKTREYQLRTSLKNIIKGEADTLVGESANSNRYGGATTEAILIRVLPGLESAKLAAEGIVYDLSCI